MLGVQDVVPSAHREAFFRPRSRKKWISLIDRDAAGSCLKTLFLSGFERISVFAATANTAFTLHRVMRIR